MWLGSQGQSLTRRILALYLMFALGGLFACVTATIYLALRGMLLDASLLTIIGPLLVVAIGAIVLRRATQLNGLIEQQLEHAANLAAPSDAALRSLPESSSIARAWNGLVQRARAHQTLESLESRLGGLSAGVAEARWQSIFDTLSDGVLFCDPRQAVVLANNSARALLGAADEDIIGRNMADLLRSALPEKAIAAVVERCVGTTPATCEVNHGEQW